MQLVVFDRNNTSRWFVYDIVGDWVDEPRLVPAGGDALPVEFVAGILLDDAWDIIFSRPDIGATLRFT